MFDWLKNLISTFKLSDPMIMQFENMMIAEEAAKQAEARTTPVTPKVEPVKEVVVEEVVEVVPAVVEPVKEVVVEEVVEVAPAVVEPVKETPAAPKRSRGAKGKFVADVKTTTETNEAWVGGKAPAKKIIKRNTKSKNK
jgi:hypothetical protein